MFSSFLFKSGVIRGLRIDMSSMAGKVSLQLMAYVLQSRLQGLWAVTGTHEFFVFCFLRSSMPCCLINVALLCMALHGLCYVLWLFAERHVALGAAQAAPSGAASLLVTQQPTVRVVLAPQQPIVRA